MTRIRLIFSVALMLVSAAVSRAESPVRFGLQWGGSANLLSIHHYNFLDNHGERVDDKGRSFNFQSNGHILLGLGVDLNDKLNLSIFSGYSGIAVDTRMFPVLLRFSVLPNGTMQDGPLFYAGGGLLLNEKQGGRAGYGTDIGAGYRIALHQRLGISFVIFGNAAVNHPQVPNLDGGYVHPDNVRRSNALHLDAGVKISLDFK